MKGFIVSLAVMLLTLCAVTLCALYGNGVLKEAEQAVAEAESAEELYAAARGLEKERLRLHLIIRETEVDALIRIIDEAALRAEDGAALEAAKRDIAARIGAMKRDLMPNPL